MMTLADKEMQKLDLMIYGMYVTVKSPDGREVRIDPGTVKIKAVKKRRNHEYI
jgi:hypothetical protein